LAPAKHSKKENTTSNPNSILAKLGSGTMSKYFGDSGDEGGSDSENAQSESGELGGAISTVFLEDLETYKTR
jgi:hypothetical protein